MDAAINISYHVDVYKEALTEKKEVMYMDTLQKKQTTRMENHYHVKDLMEALSDAQTKKSPVYAAPGPCGGCDLIIKPKELDIGKIMRKLKAADPLRPVYPCESAPCGGCDLILPCEDSRPQQIK